MLQRAIDDTGIRRFLKHGVTGVVAVAEFDTAKQEYVAASEVNDPSACAHAIEDYRLHEDGAETLGLNGPEKRYWEFFEPKCTNVVHQMQDVREAESKLADAERAVAGLQSRLKAAKEDHAQAVAGLRAVINKYRAEVLKPQAELPLLDPSEPPVPDAMPPDPDCPL